MLVATCTAWLAACAPSAAGFSEARLTTHAAALAAAELEGRAAGSAGERRALEYIARELERAGITSPPRGRRHRFEIAGGRRSGNVYGLVRGATGLADEYVVVGAHADHLGVVGGVLHPGAEDNASGVAVLLEVGKALKQRRRELGRSVVLAFFGAEEIGKVGSLAYVAEPPLPLERTVAMINIDMIGLPLIDQGLLWLPKVLFGIDDTRSVGVVGTEGRPGLRAIVNQGCRLAAVNPVAPEDFPAAVRDLINEQAKGRGDETSFEGVGIPAVFFGSGESADYHSADDTIDDLDASIMARRAAAIAATVVLLSRADWAFVRAGSG
jgi:Zn-dependent M28 family amino/carboxypeptidase